MEGHLLPRVSHPHSIRPKYYIPLAGASMGETSDHPLAIVPRRQRHSAQFGRRPEPRPGIQTQPAIKQGLSYFSPSQMYYVSSLWPWLSYTQKVLDPAERSQSLEFE